MGQDAHEIIVDFEIAQKQWPILYGKEVMSSSLQLPHTLSYSEHAHNLYLIQAEKREDLQKNIPQKRIQIGIHYPSALPFVEDFL